MPKVAIDERTPLEEVDRLAGVLWGGHYGYVCPNCEQHVYGKIREWCHAHLLEHLVEMLRLS